MDILIFAIVIFLSCGTISFSKFKSRRDTIRNELAYPLLLGVQWGQWLGKEEIKSKKKKERERNNQRHWFCLFPQLRMPMLPSFFFESSLKGLLLTLKKWVLKMKMQNYGSHDRFACGIKWLELAVSHSYPHLQMDKEGNSVIRALWTSHQQIDKQRIAPLMRSTSHPKMGMTMQDLILNSKWRWLRIS